MRRALPWFVVSLAVACAAQEPRVTEPVAPDPEPAPIAAVEPPAPEPEVAPEPEPEPESRRTPDVVYVPTPQPVVDKMLELVKPKKGELLYDLGCGDGRIVVTAAKKYGVRAIGYDIDPNRVAEARENVEKNKVGHLVTIEEKDIFELDLSAANVITLYLLPELNVKLIPQLQKLAPGSRIVSHDFDMAGVKPERQLVVPVKDSRDHDVYLWRTPLKVTSK